jgi:hypothetical protein
MAQQDYYVADNHEAASKFLGQKFFRLNIQQRRQGECNRLAEPDLPVEAFFAREG